MANTLTQQIQTRAHELGFELVGITPAERSQTIQRYRQWIASGYAGKMGYLEKHLPLKEDTRTLLQEAKSVISLAMNYWTLDTPKDLQRILGAGKYLDMRGVMTITMSFVSGFYCSLNLSKTQRKPNLKVVFLWIPVRFWKGNMPKRLNSVG